MALECLVRAPFADLNLSKIPKLPRNGVVTAFVGQRPPHSKLQRLSHALGRAGPEREDHFAFGENLERNKVKLVPWNKTSGSGCSTTVERTSSKQRGRGFESCRVLCFFSFLYPLSSASLIQVPQGGETLIIFLQKLCLAVQLGAKQA